MAQIDTPHEAQREAIRQAAHAARIEEENQVYRARVAALKNKIDSTKGGIISLGISSRC